VHVLRDSRRGRAALAEQPPRESLLAHGFTNEMLGRTVIDGLATATPQIVHAGKRPLKVVRMRITAAGRQALVE
jgi:hypothetical protein